MDPYFTKIDIEDEEDEEEEETDRTSDEIGGDNTRKGGGTEEPGGPDGGWNRRGNIGGDGPFGGGRSGFLISLGILD